MMSVIGDICHGSLFICSCDFTNSIYLNYFVDFTESDFVDKLVNEINQKSGAISIEVVPDKLSDIMVKKICELYETTEDELLEVLDSNNVITRTNSFKAGGFDFIKQNYPKI